MQKKRKNLRDVESITFQKTYKKNLQHLGFIEKYGEILHIFCFSSLSYHSLITVKHSKNGETQKYKILSENEIDKILHLTKNLDGTECDYYQLSCVD